MGLIRGSCEFARVQVQAVEVQCRASHECVWSLRSQIIGPSSCGLSCRNEQSKEEALEQELLVQFL